MEHLKKLQPLGTCPLETALGRAFWFLNCNRALSDLPGFGWNVAKAEPANIIILTDGIFTSGPFFAPEKIKHPSSDFYTEVYRPDQRVFSVLFRVPARALPMVPPFETTTSGGLAHFCLSTGGGFYQVFIWLKLIYRQMFYCFKQSSRSYRRRSSYSEISGICKS